MTAFKNNFRQIGFEKAIFALMKEQEQRFGINNMEEMEDQLKLYGY